MAMDDKDNDSTRSFTVLTAGVVISHYKIISKVGAGGMGEVWLAEDTELKRKVALKFLSSHLCQDEDCRARFKREAQATAALKHPNIVTIYEVSEYNERPFFAMELIEGHSLREIIKEKELPLNYVIDLVSRICQGLEKAHEAGIVHRDIKPSNILIDSDNRPKILDFGLATIRGGEKLTKTGSTLGTVGYMSPEQVRGEKVDQRSDLFSLGVIIYELITGKAPFAVEYDAATMNSILHDTPEPLKRYKSDVPDTLQLVIDKTLDKDKETRYQTAAGMLADLKRVKKDLEPSEITKPVASIKRGYGKKIVPAIIVIVVLLILIFKPWKFEISPRQEAIAQENKLAIMYFDNLADPEDSVRLGEIITNLLITDLSESHFVQVVSSQRLYDVLKLLGKEGLKHIDRETATQIAEKVRARWMLLGSILQVEPEIVLTAQLVDVSSGDAVASQRITGAAGESVFSLVDKFTVEIKNDLSLPVEAIEEEDPLIADVTTDSPEAYRHYIEGINLSNQVNPDKAVISFRKAVEVDSNFAMAYYHLAQTTMDIDECFMAAEKAIELSDKVTRKEKHYIKALQAEFRGDYKQGIVEFEKLVESYPDEKDAWQALADTYWAINQDFQKTVNCYNRVIEIDPSYKTAYNQLAYCYDALGDFEKSIWAINKYIELAPGEANPYDSKGELYALNGHIDEAIPAYIKAQEIRPDFWQSQERLGHLYRFKGKYGKADSIYQLLVSHPEQSVRRRGKQNLVDLLCYQGCFQKALQMADAFYVTDSLESGPVAWQFVRLQYAIYSHLGEESAAIEKVLQCMDMLKTYPEQVAGQVAPVLRKLQLAYAHKLDLVGDHNKADSILAEMDIYLRENPDPVELQVYLFACGVIEFHRGNFDRALEYAESLYLPKQRQLFTTLIMIGRCYMEAGKLGEAVTLFEKAMNQYDENRALSPMEAIKAHYHLGLAYEQSGWHDKAIEQYETFLDIWKNADSGIVQIDDAKERLASLKSGT